MLQPVQQGGPALHGCCSPSRSSVVVGKGAPASPTNNPASTPFQEGDLEKMLKARGGALLPEGQLMMKFVQLCLGLQHVHGKVCCT